MGDAEEIWFDESPNLKKKYQEKKD